MARQPLLAIAAAISFIDCINRGDLDGLADLMTDADDEESKLTVIWQAEVVGGRLSLWRVAEDTPELRAQTGIPLTV